MKKKKYYIDFSKTKDYTIFELVFAIVISLVAALVAAYIFIS
jgi:hypothetical protein